MWCACPSVCDLHTCVQLDLNSVIVKALEPILEHVSERVDVEELQELFGVQVHDVRWACGLLQR